MSGYNKKRLFTIGDYWISQLPGNRSPAYYRTWWCKKTRQTRRKSLNTANLAEAKQRLTDWFILEHKKKNQPSSDIMLSELFARFFDKYGSTLVSAVTVRAHLRYWIEFHDTATLQEAGDMQRQEEFRHWLVEKKGLSLSSVRKVITTGKSAMNWAIKRGELQPPLPYIENVKVPDPEPKGRPLEVEEVAKLLSHAEHHHLRLFLLLLIGTVGRPQAMFELEFNRIDFKRRIIDLNPKGRTQTNKVRPLIKLPETLVPVLEREKDKGLHERVITYEGKPIREIKTAWRKMRTKAGMDDKTLPYSIRHTMARWMREQGVPAYEVSETLGHRTRDYRVTSIYTGYSADYQKNAVKAIDLFFYQIAYKLRVSSVDELMT